MTKQIETSKELMQRAMMVIPGGVNSPARAFGGVGGDPIVFESANGSTLTDVDGNEYLDFVGSWGPFILGHQQADVQQAIADQLKRSTSFGAPSVGEVEIAELLCEQIEGLDKIRLVSSGTEATMSAIRVARGYTGREKIVKYAGCYHGHGDSFLIEAGSGALTLGQPSSPGVTKGTADDTIILDFNDEAALQKLFAEMGSLIAAVIIEPIAGNMGVVPGNRAYLNELRRLCSESGVLLIFDEVMTGFRVAFGGAAALYGIVPDMVTFGKIIGGGLPVGAYGGKDEIMNVVSPLGPVYQAGTLSGNPLAVAAGLATLRLLLSQDPYDELEEKGAYLEEGLSLAAKSADLPVVINRVGSMLTLFFNDKPVESFSDAKRSNTKRFSQFFHLMLQQGIYLPPSQFEAWFISTVQTTKQLDGAIAAASTAFARIASQ